MKFLFHTHLAADFPGSIAELRAEYPEHVFTVAHDYSELAAEIAETDVLIDRRLEGDILEAAARLAWLFIPFTGVNLIPLAELSRLGIGVVNNHGNAAAVAERALALCLAATGRVAEFDRDLREGDWHRNAGREQPFQFWTSLRGRRVTILGTGAIGREIARLLEPFGCTVTGYRRRGKELPPGFNRVTDDIGTALEECEVCFVALPLTPATRGLIDEQALTALSGGYLINVSRGEIVAEEPLFRALEEGRLAGAGIDAWYRYPEPFTARQLPSELPFHTLANLVLSPHAASHTDAGKRGQMEGVVENIRALVETGRPRDVVDPAAAY